MGIFNDPLNPLSNMCEALRDKISSKTLAPTTRASKHSSRLSQEVVKLEARHCETSHTLLSCKTMPLLTPPPPNPDPPEHPSDCFVRSCGSYARGKGDHVDGKGFFPSAFRVYEFPVRLVQDSV